MQIQGVRTEIELRRIYDAGVSLYGADSLPWKMFLDWWRAYPDGPTVLLDHGFILIGGVDLWPLTPDAYTRLCSPDWSEQFLTAHSFAPAATCAHWYCSGAMVMPDYQHTSALKHLLYGTITRWLRQVRHEEPISVAAIATSRQGGVVMERFGATRHGDGPPRRDGGMLYTMRVNVHALRLQQQALLPTMANQGGTSAAALARQGGGR